MELPRKDKYGNNYLSYSQISTFKRDKTDYYNQYILNIPFTGNEYTDFGSKVGESLETNNFESFEAKEAEVLKTAKRLDVFERKTILNYKDFYVIGFIDTCTEDLSEIIDYKTGGVGKHTQYKKSDYNQLHIYALSLRQETGITPTKASVQFITRGGNPYRSQKLFVANEPLKDIAIDISIDRLKQTYWEVLRVAEDINQFYKENR